MAPPPLLTLSDVGVNLGDRWLLRHVDLSIHSGDRLALVGRNGAGKSTLMKLITGTAEADEGTRWVSPHTNIAYLPQAPKIKGVMTLASYVAEGLDDSHEIYRAEALLQKMGMDPSRLTDGLSGGEARRASLAKALVTNPEVLLLDEPTNHLDLPTIEWLEGLLRERQGALVLISHDRAFLRALGNGIIWISQGKLRTRQGVFDEFEDWSEGIEQEEAVRLAKLDKKIAEETRWSHQGISARRKRNQGRLRELANLRVERARQGGIAARSMSMVTGPAEGGGQVVLEAKDVTISVDTPQGQRPLVSHFHARIRRGDRIGVIGPNGVGKSSLVRALLQETKPDGGHVKQGFGLLPAYFDQSREALTQDSSPWRVLCPDGGDTVEVAGKTKHVTSYLRDFLFDDHKMTQKVSTLSGGEQNRLLLAKIFAQPHNFLVLDEPTNDLDIETIDLLQEVVAEYDGTIMIVSHDRDFLERTVTSVLAFEGYGKIIPHAGGYHDYLARRGPQKQGDNQKGKSRKAPAKEKPKSPRSDRLSYKDVHALETLPKEIAAIEERIKQAEIQLADMNFFQSDPQAYQTCAAEVESDKKLLSEKEEAWLAAEMKKEEIEAGKSE
ncbi:MAG: ABC-F family ATP-binding cassette domain-containing protein [Candidatus Puniceispirillaceae bacterium]